MKISLCSLALLSFSISSIKEHNAYPYSNLSQIQLSRSTSSSIMTNFDLYAFAKKFTTSEIQNKTLTHEPFTEKPTSSTSQSKSPIYDPFTDKPTITVSTPTSQNNPLTYNPSTNKSSTPASTSTSQSKPLIYDPFTDKPRTPASTSTSQSSPLTYDFFTNKPTTPVSTSSASKSQSKTQTYNLYTEKSTTRVREIILTYFLGKTTTSTPIFQTYRNRYNFRHRFRNPIITIVPPLTTNSHQGSQRFTKGRANKTVSYLKFDDVFKDEKNYAYIKMALNSTPMVHLNITVPKEILEGKFPRLASPYIIRITLPRKLAPKSNTTLPNRGFLRIVGSPINMIQDGNMGLILGKIANQIGNAYNMSGKDVQKMGHVILLGPEGQRINRKATPPKKTTILTSPVMMTARLRLRLNCTLPKITDQVIYFEDYIKYFELY